MRQRKSQKAVLLYQGVGLKAVRVRLEDGSEHEVTNIVSLDLEDVITQQYSTFSPVFVKHPERWKSIITINLDGLVLDTDARQDYDLEVEAEEIVENDELPR